MERLCPICLCSEKETLYQQMFNNEVISLTNSYEVVGCGGCGFVFADKIPSQEAFSKYYAAMSKYEFCSSRGVVDSDRIEHFLNIVDFVAPYLLVESAKILDVGCSTGGLLSVLKSKGYSNLSGIDPSPACVDAVRRLHSVEAEVTTLADFESSEGFDAVILSAVLEHLVDLGGAMEKVRRLLVDSGILFVEVPDAERFADFVTAPFQQFSTEHINYFSWPSMTNLLSKHGFDIVKLRQKQSRLNRTVDPDLFVLAKKAVPKKSETVMDTVSIPKVSEYVRACTRVDSELRAVIQDRVADKDQIIVWGVGTHTQRLLGSGLAISQIRYFVDSNTRYVGKKLHGIEIRAPAEIEDGDVPILISTHAYQDEIAQQIREELRLGNEIIRLY